MASSNNLSLLNVQQRDPSKFVREVGGGFLSLARPAGVFPTKMVIRKAARFDAVFLVTRQGRCKRTILESVPVRHEPKGCPDAGHVDTAGSFDTWHLLGNKILLDPL